MAGSGSRLWDPTAFYNVDALFHNLFQGHKPPPCPLVITKMNLDPEQGGLTFTAFQLRLSLTPAPRRAQTGIPEPSLILQGCWKELEALPQVGAQGKSDDSPPARETKMRRSDPD